MTDRPFPLDFSSFTPDPKPRTWLVLPSDFEADAEPDETSSRFEADPQTVLEAFIGAGLDDKRTQLVRREGLQAELMQKSAIFGFRDYITVEAVSSGAGSQLAVYSRAMVGHWDMNVNKKRVRAWLNETVSRIGAQALGSAK